VSSYRDDKYLLTHAIWRNSYGSVQPETGVRFARQDGTYDDFRLIQHGWLSFKDAENVILRGLNKGWSASRIEDLMCRVKDRSGPKARLF
jgi:hypothetical protein